MTGQIELPDGSRHAVHDGMVIGRDPGCDLSVVMTGVSRRHARLIVRAGVVEVEDLESRNGVLLNDRRVRRRMLRDGDRVQLGRAELVFHGAAAPAPPPPSGPAPGEDLLADDLAPDEARAAQPPPPQPPEPPPPQPPEPPPPEPPEPPPPEPPPPTAAQPDAPAEPDARRPPPADDVIEFVDETVEVRRRPASADAAAATARSRAREPRTGARDVLQYNRRDDRGGLLGEDLDQLGGPAKLLLVVAAIAVAAAIGYAVFVMVS